MTNEGESLKSANNDKTLFVIGGDGRDKGKERSAQDSSAENSLRAVLGGE